MLVLSRNEGESILVGDNLRIMVAKINNHQVKIGIDAPKDIVILREEIAYPRRKPTPQHTRNR